MTEISEKEVEAAREAWREYWSDVIGQYDDNKGPMEGMRRALEAAARVRAEDNAREPLYAHPAPQPSGPVEDLLDEGLEILNALIDNIKRCGNYSPDATCTFIDQAGQCLREALSALTAGKPEQAKIESVLLDALRKIASTDLSGCANMTTAEIFGALSRMHETARVAVETAERILGRDEGR